MSFVRKLGDLRGPTNPAALRENHWQCVFAAEPLPVTRFAFQQIQ
jgi:hypothetical protein